MDAKRFDAMVRSVATSTTRRTAARLALAAALAPLLDLTTTEGKRKRSGGKHRARKDNRGKGRHQREKDKNTNKKSQQRDKGKAGAEQEQCIALEQRCRKRGEPCCGGAKCRTLLGLPLLPGRCRCPEGMRACRETCIPETSCCADSDCGADEVCQNGECAACGALDEPCCAGGTCADGVCGAEDVCVPPCTPDGGTCSSNEQCCNGECDDTGHCGPCGAAGQPCCIGAACDGNLVCDASAQCAPPCDICASDCPFDSVQDAIDAANDGDTLTLCAGTYVENISIYRNLTLIGVGDQANPGANTILQGTGSGTTVNVNPVTAALQDLRITGGSAQVGGGIFNSGTLTLTDCTVTENAVSGAGGGIFNNGIPSALILRGSNVTGNTATTGGGITNAVDSTVSLEDGSQVTGNHASLRGGGIQNQSGTVACSGGSLVSGNTAGEAGTENCFDEHTGSGCATCPA